MKRPRVVEIKDKRVKWRFRVVGANGEIICQSQGYSRRIDG